jgi:DNA polymerase-3 subunit alpha
MKKQLYSSDASTWTSGSWTAPQNAIDLAPGEESDRLGREILLQSCPAAGLAAWKGKTVTMYGYLVTVKPVRTVHGDRMGFGCFIDWQGHFLDTIHFPPCLKAHPFRGVGVYRLEGKVVDEFGFLSLEVHCMEKLPRKPDPRASRS